MRTKSLANLRSYSTRRKMMMIYFKRGVSSLPDSLKSLYYSIPEIETKLTKHIICGAHKSLANWARIQRDKRWWWSTWKEECHLLVTYWSHFNRPFRKATENQPRVTSLVWCGQKSRQLRSHSTRRKMMMIYLKRRVSSFADSLKSLNYFIQ